MGSYSESCDDGNAQSSDGCSNSCQIEDPYTCSRAGNSASSPDNCLARCGNSALDPIGTHIETCDDGNLAAGDGCSSACAIEDPFTCTRADNTNSNPDSCIHRCGNGLRDPTGSYSEACDDSNQSNGDGCSSSCDVETGYACSGGTTSSSDTCYLVCGDGTLDSSETCDDANYVNNDGCTNCVIDDDYTCTRSPASSPDICSHKCGNGLLDPQGSYTETCDDSNQATGDGCSASCTIEDAYTCPSAGSACIHKCGNG